jgi:hypothetical protein
MLQQIGGLLAASRLAWRFDGLQSRGQRPAMQGAAGTRRKAAQQLFDASRLRCLHKNERRARRDQELEFSDVCHGLSLEIAINISVRAPANTPSGGGPE